MRHIFTLIVMTRLGSFERWLKKLKKTTWKNYSKRETKTDAFFFFLTWSIWNPSVRLFGFFLSVGRQADKRACLESVWMFECGLRHNVFTSINWTSGQWSDQSLRGSESGIGHHHWRPICSLLAWPSSVTNSQKKISIIYTLPLFILFYTFVFTISPRRGNWSNTKRQW